MAETDLVNVSSPPKAPYTESPDADAPTLPPIEIVELSGRLDVINSADIRRELTDHIHEGRTRLIVDLSRADSVDSSGLAALVNAMKQARLRGGDVRIVRPRRPEALRVFELTAFDRVLTMDTDTDTLTRNWTRNWTQSRRRRERR